MEGNFGSWKIFFGKFLEGQFLEGQFLGGGVFEEEDDLRFLSHPLFISPSGRGRNFLSLFEKLSVIL